MAVNEVTVSGNTLLNYSPGILLVNLADGPPYVEVGLNIDSGPTLVTVVLDGNGSAYGVSVPVNTTVGVHTLNVVNT